uniref:Uncharacterized protein n=1 Tax=Arundo donax TaxID=35708 RepID=A0A0A9DYD6_ARUDO
MERVTQQPHLFAFFQSQIRSDRERRWEAPNCNFLLGILRNYRILYALTYLKCNQIALTLHLSRYLVRLWHPCSKWRTPFPLAQSRQVVSIGAQQGELLPSTL